MVTLTANYKESLTPETVAQIDKFLEDNFDLQCMLEFIDEHSEKDFVEFYDEYIDLGEKYVYEAVDAYLTLYDIDELGFFMRRYIGEFISPAAMADEYLDSDVPCNIVVDWEATADLLLEHDVDRVGSFYFRCYA